MSIGKSRDAGRPGMLRRLASSGSLRGAVTFALGGAGFALANVLLAAALPPEQFGLLSLIIGLMQFGLACGPLGLDIVVKRHRPKVTPLLLRVAATNVTVIGAGIALVSALFYDLDSHTAWLLFAGGVLAGGNNISYGIHQSRAQLSWALPLAQGPNYVLLLLAAVAYVTHVSTATPILVGVVVGYLAANLFGWIHASLRQAPYAPIDRTLMFREGMASVSIGIALQLLWQLERVAIPKLASISDLATYSVLAAVVGAPFRVTQFGVGFTLIERLRNAPTAAAIRAILRHEIMVALLLVAVAVVGVLTVAPIVFHLVLHDKYRIGWPLMAVTILVGVVRVAESFTTTTVTALGTAASLARISATGWISLVVALAGAVIGSRAGLVGIVSGTLLGWLTLFGSGCVLAVRSYRQRFPVAAGGRDAPL